MKRGAVKPLKICIIDMNDGQPNQAMRCLRGLTEQFVARVQATNPGLPFELAHTSPRDLGHDTPRDADLYLSTGGPGSPYDGDGALWMSAYSRFLDDLSDTAAAFPQRAPSLFVICHSFQLAVRHFKLATVVERGTLKFGVMPIYTTEQGQRHPLLAPFGDRLFAFEHRRWQAIDLDELRLRARGGQLLAGESRPALSDKGKAILALDFGPGIEGVQFHPEADRAGVMSWIKRAETAEAFREVYGESTFRAMMRTLDNPARLARTYDLFIPRWMARRFNAIAEDRGWNRLEMPGEVGEPLAASR
jgi:homoserine O-succinyltransferase/O-acetyltransferase